MAREFFKCFHNYRKKIEKLSDQEVGRLFRALMEYSEHGTAPELTGRESIAFDFIAEDIARDRAAYEQKCLTNAENGSKGGKRTQANAAERKRTEAKTSETDKIKDIRDKTIRKTDSNESAKRFHPPTVEEVKAYCEKRKNNIDPEYFVAYYGSQNWIKANGEPVHDWKLTVITWEKKGQPTASVRRGKQNPALKYEQKPISKTDFDALVVNLGEEDK